MRAYEFNASIEDGAIRIPDQYRAQLGSDVRVILLAGDINKAGEPPSFSALELKTKGFRYNREDANER